MFASVASRKQFAAFGPNGTGKTESIKDFARLIGRQPVVFNCSPEITAAVAQILGKAIAALNADHYMIVFDEYNRILPKVIVSCQSMIEDTYKNYMTFVPCFISFNPSFKNKAFDYSTYNAVEFKVPELKPIIESFVADQGFIEAEKFAGWIDNAFKDCKTLKMQEQYDFGLRAIKHSIMLAGTIWQEDKKVPQEECIGKALRLCVKGRLIDEHKSFLESSLRKMGVPAVTTEENAALTLAQLIKFRHACGLYSKTNNHRTMIDQVARSEGYEVQRIDFNAHTPDQLFGSQIKKQWHDGVLTSTLRNVAKTNPKTIIVCQGEVHHLKYEPLNTAFDQNKILVLMSGERIIVPAETRFVVETNSCKNASPAVVSRIAFVSID